DLHDVGVLQPGDRLRLAAEPLAVLGGGEGPGQDDLQGDGAVEPGLPGLVDDAHAAAAQLFEDDGAGEEGQVGRRRGRGGNPAEADRGRTAVDLGRRGGRRLARGGEWFGARVVHHPSAGGGTSVP